MDNLEEVTNKYGISIQKSIIIEPETKYQFLILCTLFQA